MVAHLLPTEPKRRHRSRVRLAADYFLVRDFELVQPLYDLAFFIEIAAIAERVEVPKYRTFSLWRAALGLDGYGTAVGRWLSGDATAAELDQPPSSRIKHHLLQVRLTGTLPELAPYDKPDYQRALKLRSVRGLGPIAIAQTLAGTELDESWARQAGITSPEAIERILAIASGEYFGVWQSAHIIPPLLRILSLIDQGVGGEAQWGFKGVSNPTEAIKSIPQVACKLNWDRLSEGLERILKDEAQFSWSYLGDRQGLVVSHKMGWKAEILNQPDGSAKHPLTKLALEYDPLSSRLDARIAGDLHSHSSWSDGAASIDLMTEAARKNGLKYLAVTDHSRSSKLQGGLTPLLWLRQATAVAIAKSLYPLLHGIEVDILKNGRLDLPDSLLALADIVVGSVHANWSDDSEVNTKRLIKAIESGGIDIIAHGTSALIGKPGIPDYVREPSPVDWPIVFRKCAEWHVAVEFNCFPSRLDLGLRLLRQAVESGCKISLGSDAHARAHLLNLRFGKEVLKVIDPNAVLNTFECDDLLQWIAKSRELRGSLHRSVSADRQQTLFQETYKPAEMKFHCRLEPHIDLPEGSSVMGIDLTAGNKLTGVALLQGSTVDVASAGTDEEILSFVERWKPAIVSIDSPLGLPGGGAKIDVDAGIVRVAEKDLASIGIPAYPALIDSMKPLTLRGIRLRQVIEAMPNAPIVIESYPGAAQDILCIPRKQRGLSLLRDGLKRLGLTGEGLETRSHDEMDAITSAIVGRFFEAGQYAPMGIPSEAQLIVPKVSPIRFTSKPIICLAGKSGAGKSVVARYLSVFYGFEWLKTRDVIRTMLVEDMYKDPKMRIWSKKVDPKRITNEDLRDFGSIVLTKHSQRPLQDALATLVASSPSPLVIDSIRDVSDLTESARASRPMMTWYVDCGDTMIRQRRNSRAKFPVVSSSDLSVIDSRVPALFEIADRVLPNDGSLDSLRWEIDDALFSSLEVSKSAN
jgi:histidinol phosphatase-like PHP family hydrolase/predicted nuclease with RNAse H fold/dephospho-CoA kinase